MALNVKFLQGTSTAYEALTVKDSTTFYRLTDTNDLYLGTTKLSNASDLNEAITRISTLEGSVETIEAEIGTLDDLSTTSKSDLVSALNELYAAIGSGGTASVIAVTEDFTSSDYAKVYTITQGGTTVGTINIPKDMVVSSGKVVVNPEGMDEGTYIALTLSDSASTVIYVNVGDLVDVYEADADAAQVQLAISADNVITATLVAGGVGTDELTDSAVTTAKVADGNITLAKLSTGVQTSLGLADSAVQSITTGTTNGTINVDNTEVAVAGLGSAAYTDASAYDAAGAAAAVLGTENDNSTAATVYGVKAYVDAQVGAVDVSSQIETAIGALDYEDTAVDGKYVSAVNEVNGVISVTRASLSDYTNAAVEEAEAYTDEALTWASFE